MWQIATKCWNPLSGAKPRWCPSTKMRIKLHWKFYFVNHLCMWNESYNHHIILQVFRSQIWMYCCAQSYASGFFLCFSPFKPIVLLASRVSNRVSLIFSRPPPPFPPSFGVNKGRRHGKRSYWMTQPLFILLVHFLGSFMFPSYPHFQSLNPYILN